MTAFTPEQQQWLKEREAYRCGHTTQCYGFSNKAVTMAGELVIGLTKIIQGSKFSANYLQRDGKRLTGLLLEWDFEGKAMGDFNDLNMDTVHEGVRRV